MKLANLLLSLAALTITVDARASTAPLRQMTQRLIEAEDLRRSDDAVFGMALIDHRAALRALAARSLGRIGNPVDVVRLAPLLQDRVANVRASAAFSLGILTGDAARSAVVAAMTTETDPVALHELELAVARVGTKDDSNILAGLLASGSARVRAGAAEGLGLLLLRVGADLTLGDATLTRLVELSIARNASAVDAAFALARYKGAISADVAAALLTAVDGAKNVEARALLVRVLGKLKTRAEAETKIEAALSDPYVGTRVEAARAVGNFPMSPTVLAALKNAAADQNFSVGEQALETLKIFGSAAAPAADAIAAIYQSSPSAWIKGAALETLAAIAPERAVPFVDAILADQSAASAPLLPNALTCLATFGDAASLNRILPFLAATELRVSSAAAAAVDSFADDLLAATGPRMALQTALQGHDVAIVGAVSDIAGRGVWRDFAAPLASTFQAMTRADDLEGKVAILGALALVTDPHDVATLDIIESALTDTDHVIGLAAADAYKAITGIDVSGRVPAASATRDETPSLDELTSATAASVELSTSKGVIVLKMSKAAPLTAFNFVKLARSGFYDGLAFHRVVPNFVAQGGDPRGDGYGGPGYSIREEVSTLSHRRGTVGMATAGKDTGGSQFFINLGPNLHLDGAYTVFATVTRGMDAAAALEQGDVVSHANVIEGN